MGIVQTIIATK